LAKSTRRDIDLNTNEKDKATRLIRLLHLEFPDMLPYQIALAVQVQLEITLTGQRVKQFLQGKPL
jgi:hypothetical protein|tara:strand:- start:940 stop:1134 length:195 start_codon:yes stop_codon:yes gene_type:complete